MKKWISKKIFESAKKKDDLLVFGTLGRPSQWEDHDPITIFIFPAEQINALSLILDNIMDLASEGIGTNKDIIEQAQKGLKILKGE